jgi:hypothetical protein
VDVGDEVGQSEYIGDIIFWYQDWGHLHFSRIIGEGHVWDGNWGHAHSPEVSLTPNLDTTPPVILPVTTKSKFGFCINNSETYLAPDKIKGDIDIIVHIRDKIFYDAWTQPAYSIYYWIKHIESGKEVVPRTLSHVRNHAFDTYNIHGSYTKVFFQCDNTCYPKGWFSRERPFYHVLTNSNGDTLLETDEINLCLETDQFNDGNYRVYVEAFDCGGNSTVDSQDVYFDNGVNGISEQFNDKPMAFSFRVHSSSNGKSTSASIYFSLPYTAPITISVFNSKGKQVATVANREFHTGNHTVSWHWENDKGNNLPTGIYFFRMQTEGFSTTVKAGLCM